MYHNARGGYRTPLVRADWRSIVYPKVRRLQKNGDFKSLNCPAWLKIEIVEFTPAKWLRYWDRRTGRKKIKPKQSR